MRANGVGFRSELLYPFIHHLRVAKRAELAEEFARDFAHRRPSGIGVHFFHNGRDGPAPAAGHTKIVDGIRVGSRAKVFPLLYDAVHPKGKAALLRFPAGAKACATSTLKNPVRAPSHV